MGGVGWPGWGVQGGGAIGIKIGAQVANQVATRGWQTCCRYLVSSLAMSSFLGHLDNFLDRSELLRKLFKVYRYSYTYFIEEEGNDDGSCNDDSDENDNDNDDEDDDNECFDHVLVAAGEGWKIAKAVSPSLPSGSQGLAPGNIIENVNRNVRAHKKTNNNYKMSLASNPGV